LVVIGIALGCSAAMALPISTPPNAIAFASGRVTGRDFLMPGLIAGLGILIVFPWIRIIGL
jgi:sodium-dependent dicarboxylate transporter 2/3/5